jgi:aminoglycoside phosphotransferase (APT) family kinase protein
VTVVDALDDLRAPLSEWLASRLVTPEVRVQAVSRPAGGQSNDTIIFDAEWDDRGRARREQFVLRREQTAHHIFRAPDVIREFRVLEGLRSSWVPVPLVRWAEPDPSVVGAPFFVMHAVPGNVPLAKPSIHSHGWLPTLTVAERTRLWNSALDALVAIHAVDWRTSHAFLLDGNAANATFAAHLDRIAEWYRWATAGREHPITDAALEFLLQDHARFDAGAPALVWGDARVGNMIFGADHRVAAVIDWEVASIGPPEIDVGHWLFFDRFATDAAGIEPLPGWPDRAATLARYEERSGRTLVDLERFEMMEELVVATTLIRQADARVARGLAPRDTRMGLDNTVTQMLARRLGLPIPELSPDYVAHRSPVRPRTAVTEREH